MLSAKRLERIFGCPCGWRGRPGQCAAFRPVAVTFSGDRRIWRDADGLAVVLAGAAAGYGGDRRRPVTGVAVRGSRRVRRARVRRTRRSCRPATARPRVNPGRLWRITLAAHSLSICSRPSLLFTARPSGPARRRCALDDREENSHNIDMWAVGSAGGASAAATRASRISPRSSGWSGRRRCPTHRRRHERCPVHGAGSDRSFPGSRDRRRLGLRSERDGLG